jgi:hypothetical protein
MRNNDYVGRKEMVKMGRVPRVLGQRAFAWAIEGKVEYQNFIFFEKHEAWNWQPEGYAPVEVIFNGIEWVVFK